MSRSHGDPKHGSTPSAPRWVKVFGIVALIVVLLLFILLLIGGGSHGPGRHARSGDTIGGTLPSSGHEHIRKSAYMLRDNATLGELVEAVANNRPERLAPPPGETERLIWRFGLGQ